jgi:flagellar export protein FliJ
MTMKLQSLKKITELKSRLTQQATSTYTESLRHLEQEQARLRELESAHQGSIGEFHDLTSRSVSAQELHSWMLFLRSQREQIEQQCRTIEDREKDCSEKLERLTETYRDERKWTRLQDRRLFEHRMLQGKAEQAVLDEAAVTGRHQPRG